MNLWTTCICALLTSSSAAFAQGSALDFAAEIEIGSRYYFEDGQYTGQSEAGFYPFVGFQLDGDMAVGGGDIALQFSGLFEDANDRSIFNVQRLYYTEAYDGWDLLVGYNVENWGVSSGRTLVNVLNARDRANRVGGSDLIGTPMVNVNIPTEIGTFSLYALGGDVVDNFGGMATRNRGQLYTNDDFATYQDPGSVDFALRYSNNFSIGDGSLDLGASFYSGTNREAVGLPACVRATGAVTDVICGQINDAIRVGYEAGVVPPQSAAEIGAFLTTNFGAAVAATAAGRQVIALSPYYQEIRQYGLTGVYAQGNTQIRFEGFLRDTEFEDFFAAILGVEYTFYDFLGGPGTMTAALEYHFDDRGPLQPTTVFEDDLFLGLNYSANDTSDSRVEFGLFYDLDTSSQLYSLSASRRIGDQFRVGMSANHVEAGQMQDPISQVDQDSFVEFSLSVFF